MSYINGTARGQSVLFPRTLDEYLDENNAVRAIDAFIEYLAFDELGFARGEPAETGRPGYDPRVLLGIFIWGHLNGVRSSRRLEQECGRNVELMWLSGQLQPDFKTLCRFRQENGEAINQVLVRFRVWCNGAELFGKELVAIDGSKFKAVNSTARNVTQGRLAKLIEREKQSVTEYMAELQAADEQETTEPAKLTAAELKQKIGTIGEYLKQHEELLAEMKESGDKQRSLTDPEARLMKTAKGMDVCYNVQLAVDSKHKLIASVAVTNEVTDQEQLAEMARQAKADLKVEELTVVADGGYFGGEVIKACEDEKITAYVPVPELGNAKRRGLFSREEFAYDASRDVYVCPQGAELTVMSRTSRKAARYRKEFRVYATQQCQGCPLRAQCTTSKYGRRIKRWVHQEVLERLQARMRGHPEMLVLRKALAEHPFGTIKVAMNHDRFLLKGLKHVATEIKLTVLSYNFKRVMSILGVATMIEKLKLQPV
jgi:transposase